MPGSSSTYLGSISGGGFTTQATSITVSDLCLEGFMGSENCQTNYNAVLGWNITADQWLSGQEVNVTGTLGLGMMSPLWN